LFTYFDYTDHSNYRTLQVVRKWKTVPSPSLWSFLSDYRYSDRYSALFWLQVIIISRFEIREWIGPSSFVCFHIFYIFVLNLVFMYYKNFQEYSINPYDCLHKGFIRNDNISAEFDSTNLYVIKEKNFMHLDFKWREFSEGAKIKKIFLNYFWFKFL